MVVVAAIFGIAWEHLICESDLRNSIKIVPAHIWGWLIWSVLTSNLINVALSYCGLCVITVSHIFCLPLSLRITSIVAVNVWVIIICVATEIIIQVGVVWTLIGLRRRWKKESDRLRNCYICRLLRQLTMPYQWYKSIDIVMGDLDG